MSILLSSGTLIKNIANIPMPNDLREAVNQFIEIEGKDAHGYDRRFSNLIFRQNLHYIIDNINKEGLCAELIKHIDEKPNKT